MLYLNYSRLGKKSLINVGLLAQYLWIYLSHDLLIAKLKAHGFDMASLSLLKNYLANRKQRTKVGSSYSDWFEFLRRIPQGSVLGPLIFNISINDIFFEIQKIEHLQLCR